MIKQLKKEINKELFEKLIDSLTNDYDSWNFSWASLTYTRTYNDICFTIRFNDIYANIDNGHRDWEIPWYFWFMIFSKDYWRLRKVLKDFHKCHENNRRIKYYTKIYDSIKESKR